MKYNAENFFYGAVVFFILIVITVPIESAYKAIICGFVVMFVFAVATIKECLENLLKKKEENPNKTNEG